MADSSAAEAPPVGRIEGGYDAIVIGAGIDAYGAAAMLGRSGLKTVLVAGDDADTDAGRREFAPGFFCRDGDHLFRYLDAPLIDAIDLYRHGLEFVSRRTETAYVFGDGGVLIADGDPARFHESAAAMAPQDESAFAQFFELLLDSARGLETFFAGDAPSKMPAPLGPFAEQLLSAPLAELLEDRFTDDRLKSALVAEAVLAGAGRPGEPRSAGWLAARWSGETAGLQGAIGIALDGPAGLFIAARRAAQAAKVDIRTRTNVEKVLVEWDRAAGVALADGGQIRAPLIISAVPANRSFLDYVGAPQLDIEFQPYVRGTAPDHQRARVHLALSELSEESMLAKHARRRIVAAPTMDRVAAAFISARAGEAAAPLVLEIVNATAFDPALTAKDGAVLSIDAGPFPYCASPTDADRDAAADAVRRTLEAFAPEIAPVVVATDVRFCAESTGASGVTAGAAILGAWTRARALAGASGIRGYFFCGPEAQVRRGADGGAGRRAAEAAMRYYRTLAHA